MGAKINLLIRKRASTGIQPKNPFTTKAAKILKMWELYKIHARGPTQQQIPNRIKRTEKGAANPGCNVLCEGANKRTEEYGEVPEE